MPKYKKPLEIVAWEMHPFIPRCCWTCGFFNQETAKCSKYNLEVPEDFARKEEACPEWRDPDGVPF